MLRWFKHHRCLGVPATASWRSPLIRGTREISRNGTQEISRNQGSPLSNATIVPQDNAVADITMCAGSVQPPTAAANRSTHSPRAGAWGGKVRGPQKAKDAVHKVTNTCATPPCICQPLVPPAPPGPQRTLKSSKNTVRTQLVGRVPGSVPRPPVSTRIFTPDKQHSRAPGCC